MSLPHGRSSEEREAMSKAATAEHPNNYGANLAR